MTRKGSVHGPGRATAGVLGVALLTALAGMAGSSQFAAAQEDPLFESLEGASAERGPIVLRSRKLLASTDTEEALQPLKEAPTGAARHVIVQLASVPDDDAKELLEEAGVRLGQYIGNLGWYATVSGDVDVESLKSLGIVAGWQIEGPDRLAPSLKAGRVPAHARRPGGEVSVSVLVFDDADRRLLKREIEAAGGEVETEVPEFDLLFVRIPAGQLSALTELDGIQWVEPVAPEAQPEMGRARTYLNTSAVLPAPFNPYNLTGSGVTVSVHDSGHAFRHNDYFNRWSKGDADTLSVELHASMTAGTIAGDGTGNSLWMGMAPGATLVTYAYGSITPGSAGESNNYGDIASALTAGVRVANNSWGYAGCSAPSGLPYGDYSSQARVYDQQVRGQNSAGQTIGSPMVVVFSAGNERDGWGGNNTKDCIAEDVVPFRNYGTINQPKPAKNIIAVGAVDSANDRMSTFSSWGPTSDGRIKPDVVAAGVHNGTNLSGVSELDNCFGTPVGSSNQQCYRTTSDTNINGSGTTYDDRYAWFSQTSAAAAMVSGNAALFIQDFRAQNAGRTPLPSTTKAHFIHTARDLDDSTTWYNPGPDYASGYGVLNIQAAVDQMRTGRWLEGSITAGQSQLVYIEVPVGTSAVKVTLAWDDPPAAPATTGTALVNDLDLIVTDPSGTQRYPWTLSSTAPTQFAVRTKADHKNNVEVVYWDVGVLPGIWTVKVKGTTVPSGPQSYSLVISHPIKSTVPDLIVSSLSGASAVLPLQSVSIKETTKNQGTAAAPATSTRFYWSTNSTYEGSDAQMMLRNVPALDPGKVSGPVTSTMTIPPNATNGTYYILAKADATGVVAESIETNNVKSLKVFIGPDLVVSALSGPKAVAGGQRVSIGDTTKNQGSTPAGASYTSFYWSTNSSYGSTDIYLGQRSVGALDPAKTSVSAGTSLLIPPAATGTYYILAKADATGLVNEPVETNNVKSLKVTVGPDLVVSSLTESSTLRAGLTGQVSDITTNQGSVLAGDSVTRFYWSTNTSYESTDTTIGARAVGQLPASTSSGPAVTSVNIPAVATSANGTYYVLAKADATGVVSEVVETNNVRYLTVVIKPDLVISEVVAPRSVSRGAQVTVTDTTSNVGTGTANASSTRYYLSLDSRLGTTDLLIGQRAITELKPGAGSRGSVSGTIPVGASPGTYYLLVVADGGSAVAESSETNNISSAAVTVF